MRRRDQFHEAIREFPDTYGQRGDVDRGCTGWVSGHPRVTRGVHARYRNRVYYRCDECAQPTIAPLLARDQTSIDLPRRPFSAGTARPPRQTPIRKTKGHHRDGQRRGPGRPPG